MEKLKARLKPRKKQLHSGPSSEDPPPDSFPDGVEVLHDCPDATVDICLIHGLTGNRDSTWTAHGQSTLWPKTLLRPSSPELASLPTATTRI